MARTAERAAYEREYRAKNADRCKANAAAYRAKNRDELAAKKRAHYAANRELIAAKARANRKPPSAEAQVRREAARLLRHTGFTAETLQAALEAQGFACAICRTDLQTLRRRDWHGDHCHTSGAPRGVLCSQCNMALGLFKDDPVRLQAAIDYLHGALA